MTHMRQTLKAMAQAIFKSWFVDSSTDVAEPVTLKKLTAKIGSGATPRGGRDVYVDEGLALIRSQNVYDSQFVWDGLARINDEAASQLANVQVHPGDVLLNITGASILRTCVVPPDVLQARVNQHVAIIRAKPGVSPHYLHLHLLQPETTTTVPNRVGKSSVPWVGKIEMSLTAGRKGGRRLVGRVVELSRWERAIGAVAPLTFALAPPQAPSSAPAQMYSAHPDLLRPA